MKELGRAVAAAWLLATLLACGGFRAGTLQTGLDTERAAGCLEMRVSPHSDERIRALGWLGVKYEFGNGCAGPVPVDLSSVVVLAMPSADAPIWLQPHDPERQIRSAALDGGRRGDEVIAYRIPPGLQNQELQVCVELQEVGANPVHPVCFDWFAAAPTEVLR